MEADRERMKTLLVEAIATLCRNGLKYTDELSVEGLIGITLDKKDVFLVSVRETYSLTSQFNQNGSESPQSQDSVGSEKVQKRSTKRSRENNGEGGPNEKHKRKGAPKKIGAHEAELINNSPAGDDLVDSLDDEDSSSFGSRIPRKREEEFVVIEDFEDDVPIKKETVISQGSDYMTSPETASSFAQMPSQNNPPKPVMASTHTVSRAPPPLHPRPDQVSPRAADQMDIRFQHPAGVSNDQLILAQDIKVEHDSDSSMSVYRSPSGEIIKVPRNMNAESNIPVTVSVMAGVGGTQSVQGMHDTSGGPDDWATPSSSQEFITLPGSDSLQESPSQQAPGSSGASQQEDLPVPDLIEAGKLKVALFTSGSPCKKGRPQPQPHQKQLFQRNLEIPQEEYDLMLSLMQRKVPIPVTERNQTERKLYKKISKYMLSWKRVYDKSSRTIKDRLIRNGKIVLAKEEIPDCIRSHYEACNGQKWKVKEELDNLYYGISQKVIRNEVRRSTYMYQHDHSGGPTHTQPSQGMM